MKNKTYACNATGSHIQKEKKEYVNCQCQVKSSNFFLFKAKNIVQVHRVLSLRGAIDGFPLSPIFCSISYFKFPFVDIVLCCE